jgi:hypothetical protein
MIQPFTQVMNMTTLVASLLAAATMASSQAPPVPESRLYELRVYYAPEGKLDALHARFRDHTMKLFEKHGMTNVGYWVPLDNPSNKLIYVLSYPNSAARANSWKAFQNDPEWRQVHTQSEKDGRLVMKVDKYFMQTTDFSPKEIKNMGKEGRIFELRTYTTTPGNLAALQDRFRDHTVKLFEKHGMTNLWYWTLDETEANRESTLVYFLAHDSKETRDASFAAFRSDPAWQMVLKESEAKAGGSLTTKDGVQSILLKPTDYSPIK